MSQTILSLINTSLENEKATFEYIEKYSKSLGEPSLKKLLVSIMHQEEEHEKQLQELLDTSVVGEAYADGIIDEIHINSFKNTTSTQTDLSSTQILQLLMKHYAHTETVYKQLAKASLDSEIRIIFLKLAVGELKLKQWVKDRYDLEILSR